MVFGGIAKAKSVIPPRKWKDEELHTDRDLLEKR